MEWIQSRSTTARPAAARAAAGGAAAADRLVLLYHHTSTTSTSTCLQHLHLPRHGTNRRLMLLPLQLLPPPSLWYLLLSLVREFATLQVATMGWERENSANSPSQLPLRRIRALGAEFLIPGTLCHLRSACGSSFAVLPTPTQKPRVWKRDKGRQPKSPES